MLPQIKARTDAVLNLTSGGSPFMTIEERIQPSMRFAPEVASLNMGPINFALFPMLERFKEFRHDWERQHLENSRDLIFRNTFKDIEYALAKCAPTGTRFELECYDIGHLYNLAHMRRTADRLFGKDCQWSVPGAGRHQMTIATI